MSAQIIDGRAVAERIRRQTAEQVRQLRGHGVEVRLHAVMVGSPDSGEIYARSQAARCREVGIAYKVHTLPADSGDRDIIDLITRLNHDPAVTGILLNLPLPQGIDAAAVQYAIDPYKDAEGVNPANIGFVFYDCPIIAPCTALAVMEMLKEAGWDPRGRHAVVVGQGAIAGRPTSLFLLQQMATVTACHIETRDLTAHTRRADLLVAAAGVPELIRGDHIKPGAVIVDVGINRVANGGGGTRIVGDVLFKEAREVAAVLTPVPGGVGPVTVAILMRSAVEAARKQHLGKRRRLS
jgi:methylenetetrahydrofolate dehydrogenase (NADP+)/methenyltetrahydrofolate cyclohydrolase